MNEKRLIKYFYSLFVSQNAPFYEIFQTFSDFLSPFLNLIKVDFLKNMLQKTEKFVSDEDHIT